MSIYPSDVEDQSELFAFLGASATYGLHEPVVRIDTHGAAVFLAGPDVYKVKRAVRYPFMDFSTLEKRRRACEAEIRVNRVNAPDIYIGVVPVTREGSGLRLGGSGKVVDWTVHLRRFDEGATLDRIAAAGPLGPELTDKLAVAVAGAHFRAPQREGGVATRDLRGVLVETLDELVAASDLFPPERVESLRAKMLAAFERVAALLFRRGAQGMVRRCHGDLHLGNIALIAGSPILFDAIEFDEALATSDTLYDLAFLVMDLCEKGLTADANRLLNRYLSLCEGEQAQIEGLAALPLFLSLRAAVRAKVLAAQCRLGSRKPGLCAQATAYFDAAGRFLAPAPPRLIAIGGLSGTGKTTLTAAIAPHLGVAPGALHLRSDVERKRLFGVKETTRLGAEAYGCAVSSTIYETLHALAEEALRAGRVVIVDATYQNAEQREAVAAVALRVGAPFSGIWLEAPVAILKQRVTDRKGDASDATADVVDKQSAQAVGPLSWRRLDASRPLGALVEAALLED